MPIIFDGKKIIPSPFVNINKSYATAGDGTKIGTVYSLILTGSLVAWKGSPSGNLLSSFWTLPGNPPDQGGILNDSDARLESLLRKEEGMRRLFALEGKTLEIEPLNGSAPIKCNPRVLSIDFAQGVWFDRVDYTINMEADQLFIFGTTNDEDAFSQFLTSASEDWQLEFGELDNFYNLTHNVNAVGKVHYDSNGILVRPAWEEAREWVQDRLGLDLIRIDASGSFNLFNTALTGYNHVRAESVNELGGSYGVSESWVIASGAVIEDFNVNLEQATNDNRRNTVTIEGSIKGLDTRDASFNVTNTKYQSASGHFASITGNLFSRAQTISGFTLNVTPVNKSIGRNTNTGIITYSTTYDDRPSNIISDALTEDISVTDNFNGQVIAAIPIIGRAKGPILQDIGTVTARTRSLNISVSVSGVQSFGSVPNVSGIISLVEPTTTQVFKTSDTANWNWKEGRYTRNVGWIFQG